MLEHLRHFAATSDSPPRRMAELSPLWHLFEDPCAHHGVVISFDLAASAALRLEGASLSCKSESSLEAVSATLAQALTATAELSLARFYCVELTPYSQELRAYIEQFREGSFPRYLAAIKAKQCAQLIAPRKRELFAVFSTPPELTTLSYTASALGRSERLMKQRAREVLECKLRELRALVALWKSRLEGAGILARALAEEELFSLLWRMANPMRGAWSSPPRRRRGVSLRSQLYLSGLENHPDHFEREHHYHRVVSLKLLPEAVRPGIVNVLTGFAFPYVLCVGVRRLASEAAIKQLTTSRSQGYELKSLLARYRGRERAAELPEHQLEAKQRQANDALALVEAGDTVCELACQVLLSGASREKLDRHTEEVLAAFRALGRAEGAIEEHRSRIAYMGIIPGHQAIVGERYLTALTSRAADMLPVFAPHAGAKNPSYLLTTPEHTLYGFDPFNPQLSAHNATVAASTGRGKSVTVRLLQLGFLARGGRGVVITRGTDYHRYAELLGGEAYDVSLEDSKLALGPFWSPRALAPQSKKGRARIAQLCSILAVLATEGHGLNRVARHLIYRALDGLYRRFDPDKAPTFKDYLGELEALRANHAEAETQDELISNLRFWLEGPHQDIFCCNRPPIEKSLTVWNLAPIQDPDLQSVVLALLSGIVARSIAQAPTIITLDECWSILKSQAGEDLVVALYRTVRKEGSCVWGISQSIDDFQSLSPGCRTAILNNSPVRVFLAHENAEEIEKLARLFALNPKEKERVSALVSRKGKYSDLMLFTGEHHQVLQLALSGEELWMSTSDKQDVELEQRVRERYPHHSRETIVRALGREFPHGAAYGRKRRAL